MGAVLAKARERLRGLSRWQIVMIVAAIHSLSKMLSLRNKAARFRKMTRHLPGRGHDLTGTVLRKNLSRLNDWTADLALKHRDSPSGLVKVPTVFFEVCAISPSAVETVLTSEYITKADRETDVLFKTLAEFLGEGVFTLRHGKGVPDFEHKNWKNQRKTTSKIFTRHSFNNNMEKVFQAKTKPLLAALEAAAKNDDTIDVQDLFHKFTMDSIQKIFFSTDVDSITDGSDPYAQNFDKANRMILRYLRTVVPAQVLSIFVLPWPFGMLWLGFKDFSLTSLLCRKLVPSHRTFDRAIYALRKETKARIKKIRARANQEDSEDLITKFLGIGQDFTDEELCDITLNLIIAGRDTTAITLTWLCFELANNPHVQKQLTEEIDRVMRGDQATAESVQAENMPYLQGCLYETLRLHPAVPLNHKVATEDVQFPCGTVIPKDTRLTYCPYAMGRDPKRYDNPLEFRPERWIPFKEPSMYEFPVFQAGQRFCLGKDMAKMEAKMVIVSILQRFQFEFAKGSGPRVSRPEECTYAMSITLSICDSLDQTSHHLWLKPVKRTPLPQPQP